MKAKTRTIDLAHVVARLLALGLFMATLAALMLASRWASAQPVGGDDEWKVPLPEKVIRVKGDDTEGIYHDATSVKLVKDFYRAAFKDLPRASCADRDEAGAVSLVCVRVLEVDSKTSEVVRVVVMRGKGATEIRISHSLHVKGKLPDDPEFFIPRSKLDYETQNPFLKMDAPRRKKSLTEPDK